jgi:hypothetical protein
MDHSVTLPPIRLKIYFRFLYFPLDTDTRRIIYSHHDD